MYIQHSIEYAGANLHRRLIISAGRMTAENPMVGYDARRKLLYYPSIAIPNGQWLRQAVLYWDIVSSIVPQQYLDEHPKAWGAHIEFLRSEGQYEPCDPAYVVNSAAADRLVTELALLIRQITRGQGFSDTYRAAFRDQLPLFCGDNESLTVGMPASSVPLPWPGRRALVHASKMSGDVLRQLTKEGLVASNKAGSWTQWDPRAALVYLSLLAKYMASESNDNISVGTDFSYLQDFVLGSSSAPKELDCPTVSDVEKNVALKTQLLNLLPVPRLDVPLEDIVKFKRKRRDELLRLRKELDTFYARLSESENYEQLKDHLTSSKEEIELGVYDLRRTLGEAKIAFWTGLSEGTLQLKTPGWIAGATLGGLAFTGSLALTAPIVGMVFAGAITIGVTYSNWIITRNRAIRQSPYAYLYSAQAEDLTL